MRVRLGGGRRGRRGTFAHASAARAAADAAPAAAALRLPAAYDVLDVPAGAGHRVLLQLERLGTPLGPVLTVGARHGAGDGKAGGGETGDGSRLQFFVEAGTTASFLADLKDLGWEPADTDIRTIGVVLAAETALPPAASPRWVRPPETVPGARAERPVVLPPARLLLGALAHACRRAEQRRFLFAGSRAG